MNWTMNTAQLETGMLIRRPGLDEALEVVQVRNGQAKIKLPGGKTSTIPAASEVEFAWPEKGAEPKSSPQPKSALESLIENVKAEHEMNETSDGGDPDWQTDWSLLTVGAKISVLGEEGEFTVLRLTDSSARIKSNATGQIVPLSIGHKFKVIESGKTEGKVATRKPKSKKASPIVETAPEPEEITDEPEHPFDDGATDSELLSDDEIPTPERDSDSDDDDESEEDEFDPNNDPDIDDFEEEEAEMPKSTKQDTVNKSSAKSGDQLLTLVEVAERTGISYPTLSRYVREHGDRLPSEGSGRKRRFYASAIDVFREIRGESRSGRKPMDGSKRTAAKTPRKVKRSALASGKDSDFGKSTSKGTAQRTPNASVSVASWVPANGQTIDSMLASAIEHAEAQISGLQSLVETLKVQREQLKLWS